MKKLILFPFLLLLGYGLFAQSVQDSMENNWDLNNYIGNAAVTILNADSARIQKNTRVFTFKIKTEQQFVYLADKKNNEKILTLLEIKKYEIDNKFTQYPKLLPAEKLLTVAHSFPDQKLLIGKIIFDHNNTSTSLSDESAPELADQNFAEKITAKNEHQINWFYFILFDIIALGIGLIIGMNLRKKGQKAREKANTEAIAPQQSMSDIQKLQNENAFLQQRMSRALMQLEDAKAFDEVYFQKAFEQIILPLQESLEKGDKSKTLELLTIAAAQLSSISRTKIGKKLKHDDSNIRYLNTQNKNATQEYPEISAQTAIDKIPNNIKVLLEILKANEVDGLDDTVVMGYKIKDL